MILSQEDRELFYKLHSALLTYVNRQKKVLKGVKTPEELRKRSIQDIAKLSTVLWDDSELMEEFARLNPFSLSPDELEIVLSWQHRVTGSFVLLRHLKKHAVFLDASAGRVYGVIGISDELEELLGPSVPVLLETVLIPFKDRIIHHGFFQPYLISFGGGICRSFNDDYQRAKSQYGIITRLPFSPETVDHGDEQLLKFYLKSQSNREQYQDEIWELTAKSPHLLILYHQEMGKVHARHYRKRLTQIGVRNAWFAIVDGVIVAGAKSKQDLQRALEDILPHSRMAHVFIFSLRRAA
jgi:hypothetical protein